MAKLWVGEPEILRSRNFSPTGPEVQGSPGRWLRNPLSHLCKENDLDGKNGRKWRLSLTSFLCRMTILAQTRCDRGGAWVVLLMQRLNSGAVQPVYLVSEARTWAPSCPVSQPGVVGQMIEAAEERPWLWVVYILTVALPVFLVILFCCSGKVRVFLFF